MRHRLKLGDNVTVVELHPMSERPVPKGYSTALDMWLAYDKDGSYMALAYENESWVDPLGCVDVSNVDDWLGWCCIPEYVGEVHS